MIGNRELARIHAMKKQAELTDEDYRTVLAGAAGVDSAKDIETPDQYYNVITALSNLLTARNSPAGGNRQTFRDAVKARAARILGENYQVRLSGYLRKMGQPDLNHCTDLELRRVMGFLSNIDRGTGR
jgi:hypothetical protein